MSHDELIDVVDESGRVLQVLPKFEAHRQGLLHKTVIGEVIDSQGRWLLVRQAKDRQDAEQYVSPVGGHVLAGESDEDALTREANEELGLSGTFKYEYMGREIFNRFVVGRQENHFFIMFKIYSDTVPVLNHESESYKYFYADELRVALKEHPEQFGGAFHFVMQKFFSYLVS